MQTPHNNHNKGIKFLDTKVFIASLSIAVTVGLWNLFSNEAILAAKGKANPNQSPSQPPANEGQDLPPLPTLIPLVNGSNLQGNGPAPVNQSQATILRSVAAPDQVIVQKVKPVIDQPVLVVSGGGSGGGSSSPVAVTTTRSSR
jgi:hypothetical protein